MTHCDKLPKIETHPLSPFIPPMAQVLLLGSFPPPKQRWQMPFYYPNINNDMWRIMGQVFFDNALYFIDNKRYNEPRLRKFLVQTGIAISDSAYQVRRSQGNAADQLLQIIKRRNIKKLLQTMPACHSIITTGELATQLTLASLNVHAPLPKVGARLECAIATRKITLYRLPSSSRAYSLALDKKAEYYKEAFKDMGLLD